MKVFVLVLLLLVLAGCQDNDRLARLEKENETLKAQLQDKNKVRDYDLEVRCSKVSVRANPRLTSADASRPKRQG